MKKTIILSIFLLGVTSVVGQLLIIRETTINFYGNEFFIGWIVFAWLFWTGIGSLVLGKLFSGKNTLNILILCHFLIGIFLILKLPILRVFNFLSSNPSGQIPELIPSLFYVFLALAPLCLFLGLQFSVAAKLWNDYIGKEKTEKIIGKTYFWESLGFVFGGLIFGYFLVFLNEFDVILILGWLNVACGGLFVFRAKKKSFLKFSALALIVLASFSLTVSDEIDAKTKKLRFPNQELIISKNSQYGNIAVTKIQNRYNFYESGLLLGMSEKEVPNEHLTHISMLYQQNPEEILLIGNGFDGTISEILKHNPNRIYYLEIDPMLIETIEKYFSKEIKNDLMNEKVKIINADARNFVKTTKQKFDVVIINLPNPSTALINRLYTQEFFKDAAKKLNANGVLSTHISSQHNYLGPETENLNISVFNALKNAFPSVVSLPEEENLFIASFFDLDYNAQKLIERLKQRKIENSFVNEAYIENRLTNDRIQKFLSIAENRIVEPNQDQLPKSYYYNFIYWVSSFHPRLAKIFSSLNDLKFAWFMVPLLLILISIIIFRKKQKEENQVIFPLIMAVSGFSLLATEIIILLGFQIFYGNLYYRLATIITALMLGMAFGSYLGTEKIEKFKFKSIIAIHVLIVLFLVFLLLGFNLLFRNSPQPSLFIEIFFSFSAMIIGAIIGLEFPLINKFYLENSKNAGKKTGIVYGADLLGSCLGASLVSVFFVPIFGIFQSLIFLILLNVFALISLFILRPLRQKLEQ